MLFIIIFLFLALCEIFSRTSCGKLNFSNQYPSCYDLSEKYQTESKNNDIGSNIYSDDVNNNNIEEIITIRTKEVKRSEIGGANGISCYDMNYIADDLPYLAKKYVKLHEAFHFAGEYNETKANYLAAQKEPLGFIETISYSIFLGLKNGGWKQPNCYLGRTWNIFKMYFLNIREDSTLSSYY